MPADGGGPPSLAACLLEFLGGLEAAGLAAVLVGRPDAAAEPRPVTLHQLAVRLSDAEAVQAVLARCDQGCRQLAAVLHAATGRGAAPDYGWRINPADSPPVVARAAVYALVGAPGQVPVAEVDRVVEQLAALALAWPAPDGRVVVHPGLNAIAHPRRGGADVTGGQGPGAFTPRCPQPATTPVTAPVTGAVTGAVTGVAGGVSGVRLESVLAAGSAQAAAVAVEHAGAVLAQIDKTPLECARTSSGGVRVPDVRRLGKTAGCGEGEARMWLHIACQAGLVKMGTREDLARYRSGTGRRRGGVESGTWLHTGPAYPAWRSAGPAERLAALIGAWLQVAAMPTTLAPPIYTYRMGDGDRLPGVLSADARFPAAPQIRAVVLAALAGLPVGHAAGEAELAAVAAWRRPRLLLPAGVPAQISGAYAGDRVESVAAVAAVLHDTEILGLTYRGALTALGRAAVDHAALHPPGVPQVGQPAPVVLLPLPPTGLAQAAAVVLPVATTVVIQADHTAIATGVPAPALAALLDSCAEVESAGAHSRTWRLTPTSVRRHLDNDGSAAGLLAALHRVAPGGVPQVVEYLIGDVGRRHGHISVATATVLSTDAATAARITADPHTATALRLRAGAPADEQGAVVLVCGVAEQRALTVLREAGYAPTPANADHPELPAPKVPATGGSTPHRPGGPIRSAAARSHSGERDPVEAWVAQLTSPAEPPPPLDGPLGELAERIAAAAPVLGAWDCAVLADALTHTTPVTIEYATPGGATATRTIRRPALQDHPYGSGQRLIGLTTQGRPDNHLAHELRALRIVLPHTPPRRTRR